MENHTAIIKWATHYMDSMGYSQYDLPKIVLETPWSNMFRLATTKGLVYLKQTPPSTTFSLEPKITQLLVEQFHAPVPKVIAVNDELHCFLMEDAGESFRIYLKNKLQPDLMCQSILQYTAIQRVTEKHVESFVALGVADWRGDTFPKLYEHIISQTAFLEDEGMTDEELVILHKLNQQIVEEYELLSECLIPQTMVQSDFHTNNILMNPTTKKLTFIDLGEIVVTHPFFSLHTFLRQAIIHHDIKEGAPVYKLLQSACLDNWLELGGKNKLLKGFLIAKKLWPIYSALILYRFMHSLDIQAFKAYYANRPNRLAGFFREYIASN